MTGELVSNTIWPFICEYKIKIAILFFLKCGLSIPPLITPLIFMYFVDRVIEQKNIKFMQVIVLLYILLFAFETILKVVHRYLDNRMFNDITYKLRKIAWKNCLYMPYAMYAKYDINEIKKRINEDIDMVKFFIIGEIFDYIANFISLVVIGLLVFFVDWRMGSIFCVFIPISIILSRRFQNQISDLREEERQLSSHIDKWIHYSLKSWKEIKSNLLEEYQKGEYEKLLKQQHKNKKSRLSYMLNQKCILDIKKLYVDQLLLFLFGGIFRYFYMSTIGSVLACIQYYGSMIVSLSMIIEINMNMGWVKPAVYRAIELLTIKVPDINDNRYSIKLQGNKAFEIRQINYSYPNSDKNVFNNLNIEIFSGEKALIMGTSGIGKSTLLRLMTKNLEEENNTIFFYENELSNIEQFCIYQYIRVIYQSNYYMNTSIKDYLKLANEFATEEELIEACQNVKLMEYIDNLPDKFETFIGENGGKMSGGQKQKLALARLFLVNNKILLLDEAFSAIDGKDKMEILSRLLNKYNNNTIICVTHDEGFKEFFGRIIRV